MQFIDAGTDLVAGIRILYQQALGQVFHDKGMGGDIRTPANGVLLAGEGSQGGNAAWSGQEHGIACNAGLLLIGPAGNPAVDNHQPAAALRGSSFLDPHGHMGRDDPAPSVVEGIQQGLGRRLHRH